MPVSFGSAFADRQNSAELFSRHIAREPDIPADPPSAERDRAQQDPMRNV
jgi:hypothetical protein